MFVLVSHCPSILNAPFISIVIPCLNEADSIGYCLDKIAAVFSPLSIEVEVIVADNGSSDRSAEIALAKGAQVLGVPLKGYGAALKSGIDKARGEWIIIGDADGSYDFSEIPRFLEQLQLGADFVIGCRLPSGKGTILPGAMPWMHEWIGNPFFSQWMRIFHDIPINDVYCGLRAFKRSCYRDWNLSRSGMEFAVEMVLRAKQCKHRILEIPITLHRDRRIYSKSHLRTFRDGWRTLWFLMVTK